MDRPPHILAAVILLQTHILISPLQSPSHSVHINVSSYSHGQHFGLGDTEQTKVEREYSSRQRRETSRAIMLTICGTSCSDISASQSTGTSHFRLRHFTAWKARNAIIGVAYPPHIASHKTHWQIEVEGRNLIDDFTHERNRKTIKGHTMPWFKQEGGCLSVGW